MNTRSITLWKIAAVIVLITMLLALQHIDQRYANKVGTPTEVEHVEFLN